jgi:hypothetical protein
MAAAQDLPLTRRPSDNLPEHRCMHASELTSRLHSRSAGSPPFPRAGSSPRGKLALPSRGSSPRRGKLSPRAISSPAPLPRRGKGAGSLKLALLLRGKFSCAAGSSTFRHAGSSLSHARKAGHPRAPSLCAGSPVTGDTRPPRTGSSSSPYVGSSPSPRSGSSPSPRGKLALRKGSSPFAREARHPRASWKAPRRGGSRYPRAP